MENKQLVTIKVGSILEYKDGDKEIVKDIAINFAKSKSVFLKSGEWDRVLLEELKSIDGIPVDQISDVCK